MQSKKFFIISQINVFDNVHIDLFMFFEESLAMDNVGQCITMPLLTLCVSSFPFSDLISGIRKETEAGRLPTNVASGMEELYWNYKKAVNE